jgi:hypothetical protein
MRKKLERAGAVAVGVVVSMLAVPGVARAALYVYTPSGGCSPSTSQPCVAGAGDLNDLDHHYVYAWQITDPNLQGKTISSASITFGDLFNWDTEANQLYLNLLSGGIINPAGKTVTGNSFSGYPYYLSNSSTVAAIGGGSTPVCNSNSCVTQFNDDNTSDSPVTTLCDSFTSGSGYSVGCGNHPNFATSEGWLVSSSTGDDFLTSQGFWSEGTAPTSADSWATMPSLGSCTPGANGCWYYTLGGKDANDGNAQLYNYTFVFGTNDLSELDGFIATSDDFGLGVDADCHLFNNGITLDLSTNSSQGGPGVPEPASLTLLGLGLVTMSRFAVRRRGRQAKSEN